jgi:hypothetical protein
VRGPMTPSWSLLVVTLMSIRVASILGTGKAGQNLKFAEEVYT